jgi:hypothetical protein
MLADAVVLRRILGDGPAAAVVMQLGGWTATDEKATKWYQTLVTRSVSKAQVVLVKTTDYPAEDVARYLRSDLASTERPKLVRKSYSKKRPAATAAEPEVLSHKDDPALNGANAARAAAADSSGTLLVDAAYIEALTLLEAGGRGSRELDALIETHRAADAADFAEAGRVAAERARVAEAAAERARVERAATERARLAQVAAARAQAERAAAERARVAHAADERARVERAAFERARVERAQQQQQQQQRPGAAKRDHSPQGSGIEDPLGLTGDEDDGAMDEQADASAEHNAAGVAAAGGPAASVAAASGIPAAVEAERARMGRVAAGRAQPQQRPGAVKRHRPSQGVAEEVPGDDDDAFLARAVAQGCRGDRHHRGPHRVAGGHGQGHGHRQLPRGAQEPAAGPEARVRPNHEGRPPDPW